jgi:hypothetical protein
LKLRRTAEALAEAVRAAVARLFLPGLLLAIGGCAQAAGAPAPEFVSIEAPVLALTQE